MYRATTPTLNFTIRSNSIDPKKQINLNTFNKYRVCIYQEPNVNIYKNIVRTEEKTETETIYTWAPEDPVLDAGIRADIEKSKVIIDLTQDEMNQFHYGDAFCQLRAFGGNHKAFASRPFQFEVEYILNDDVL